MTAPRGAATGRSVTRAVLLPIALLGVLAAGMVTLAIGYFAERHLEDQLRQRAETIAHAIGNAAESTRHADALRRVVSGMAAEPDVELITVIGGSPLRVLAATRSACIGADATVDGECADARLRAVARAGTAQHVERLHGESLGVSLPLVLVTEAGQAGSGALTVQLDAGPTRAAALGAAQRIGAALLGALFGLAGATAWALRRHVLLPLREIESTVALGEPAEPVEIEPDARNEIQRFARVLGRALRERARREAEAVLLHRAAELACREIDAGAALEESLGLLAELLEFPIGHVALVDDGSQEVVPSEFWYVRGDVAPAAIERFREVSQGLRFAAGEGLPGRVLASREPHWIEDVQRDGNFPRASVCRDIGLVTAVAAPILAEGRCIAVMQLFSPARRPHDARLLRAVGDVCRQIGRVVERKRAEERVRRARLQAEHLQQALDETAIVAVTDVRGRILYANDRFCEISGWSRDELLGANHRILASGEHSRAFFREMYRTIARGRVWRGEIKNRRKDGSFYWVDTTIVPSLGANGKVERYTSVRIDITERVESQRGLQHANANLVSAERRARQLLTAIEAAGDAIFVCDTEGTVLYCNAAFSRISGWRGDEIVGRSPSVLKSGRTDPGIYADLWSTIRAGGAWKGRLLNRRARHHESDGREEHYWVEATITPVHGESGEIVAFVAVQRDVTERVAREEEEEREREASELRLAVARAMQNDRPLETRFDEALALICAMRDLDAERRGGIFLRTAGAVELSLCRVHGRFSDAFLRDEASVPLGRCLCGRAAVSGEVLVSDDCFDDHRHENRWPDMARHGHYVVPLLSLGETVGVLFLYTAPHPSRSPARMAALKTIGEILALEIVRDRAIQASEEARRRAEEASRSKSDFLATMSHEIRTPMNAVIGFTNLLLDTTLDTEQRDLAHTIQSAGQALLSIINDILDFSKIEAGRMVLEEAIYAPGTVAQEAVELMGARAEEKGVELLLDWPDDVPLRALGDAARLRQVLLNLVGNALKFTEHGQVVVSARRDEGPGIRVAVEDTGIGIPADRLPQLFAKFVQADSSTTRRFGGTGLGLAISKQLVELMGGEIGVESEQGRGSTFWVRLPLRTSEARRERDATERALAGRRALVVGERDAARAILTAQLRARDMECVEAHGPASVLALLESEARAGRFFDVVLIDQRAGSHSGEELCCAIRAQAGSPRVALVLMVPAAQRGDRARFASLGVDGVLVKPLARVELVAGALLSAISPGGVVPPPVLEGRGLEGGFRRGTALSIRWHVLVAEDNPVNQKLAVRTLEKLGCRVDVAGDGVAACERVAATRFDVVFMDCHMPEMDGLDATRVIRGREEMASSEAGRRVRRTPIIALTAGAVEGDRERCLAAGMDDYVSKPFTIEQIAAALQRWAPPDGAPDEEGRIG